MRIWQWGCPIFTAKSGRVLHLVHYGASVGCCVCVCDAYRHACTVTSQSPPKHVDTCRIHGETNVTWWHGSRQSHRNDRAHNIVWICTCNNRLEHIPILQGQVLSWLEIRHGKTGQNFLTWPYLNLIFLTWSKNKLARDLTHLFYMSTWPNPWLRPFFKTLFW